MTNKIIIGDVKAPLYEFEAEIVGKGANIREITGVTAVDVVGAELSIDQLAPKVQYDVNAGELWTPSDYGGILSSDGYLWATNRTFDDIRTLSYGEAVRYYHNGKLTGKFYIKNVDRISREVYQINAMSASGLLDSQRHYGGIYTGQTFREVVTSIIGGAVNFTCNSDVAAVKIFGWLPIASKRKNIHQLLFATGTTLTKDENGDIRFVFLSGGSPARVSDKRIYYGGNVDYSAPASAVEITEHTFYAQDTDDTVTLFDNTDGSGAADNTLVSFQDAPVHALSVDGNLTIISSGVNYAIVTGTGVLTGKKYTHTSKVIRKESENAAGEENVVTVTEATLVSVANSENVARRVFDYYSSKKTVSCSLVVEGERAGDQLSFSDPFGEASTGFLASMEINVSSDLKAECTIITDFVPAWHGNNYSSSRRYTGSGTFTIPQNGGMAVLIGGGDGGSSGCDGTDGYYGVPTRPGVGGEAGSKGRAGKILTVQLPAGTYRYSCGSGGAGAQPISGSAESQPGEAGTATTVYSGNSLLYSSDSGQPPLNGYMDQFTGQIYALDGEDGVKGGNGGQPRSAEAESVTFHGVTYPGGTNGDYGYYDYGTVIGGGGGGAAVGSPGGNGEDGSKTGGPSGGNGGSAIPGENATSYGNGGNGGHGGGGGGSCGMSGSLPQSAGRKGSGSKGGNGSAGCLLVYT